MLEAALDCEADYFALPMIEGLSGAEALRYATES